MEHKNDVEWRVNNFGSKIERNLNNASHQTVLPQTFPQVKNLIDISNTTPLYKRMKKYLFCLKKSSYQSKNILVEF